MSEKIVKRSGSRNRTAGHNFERKAVLAFKTIGFEHISSSRLESRSRDNAGIDLCNKDEDKNGRFPYNVQCKSVANKVDYHRLLSELARTQKDGKEINVVFHQLTKKAKTKFMTQGEYAILSMNDFLEMVALINQYKGG